MTAWADPPGTTCRSGSSSQKPVASSPAGPCQITLQAEDEDAETPTGAITLLGFASASDERQWALLASDYRQAPSTRSTMCSMTSKGHHPRRRRRHAPLSCHPGRVEAVAAGLRQADDLLPAQHADAGGHPRHPGHLDAAGHAALRAPARRRLAVGPLHSVCRPARAGRAGAGVHHRARVRRRRAVGARARRQHLLRRQPPATARARRRAHGRRHGVRLSRGRSGTLRRGRVRRGRARHLD